MSIFTAGGLFFFPLFFNVRGKKFKGVSKNPKFAARFFDDHLPAVSCTVYESESWGRNVQKAQESSF